MTSFDKIICVGKNYLDHAKEMGDAVPEEPVFFLKPPSALKISPIDPVPLPKDRGAVHHELEIVYHICKTKSGFAFDQVTLGLDLTLRDLQTELKKKGHPWEASKAFPHSAVIGEWIALADFKNHLTEEFELLVNGDSKQKNKGLEMRRSPKELLEAASAMFDVQDGDLLFTGTPKGVGPILSGDDLTLIWGNHLEFEVRFI